MDKEKDWLQLLPEYLKDKSVPMVLLILSTVLVAFSIAYDRHFDKLFATFIYAIGATYLITARKQESFGQYIVGTKLGVLLWTVLFWGWFGLYVWLVLPEIVGLRG